MKRFASALLAFIMFFAFALPAFAVTSAWRPSYTEKNSQFMIDGIFTTSALTQAEKDFMLVVLSSERGFIATDPNVIPQYIWFCLADEGVTPVRLYTGYQNYTEGVAVEFSRKNPFRHLAFFLNDDNTWCKFTSIQSYSGPTLNFGYFLSTTYFNTNNFTFPDVGFEYLWPNNLKPLILQDDGGLMSSPTPDPDPPPVDPIPPYNSDYVPYDPVIFQSFSGYIKNAIGDAVNVAITIFSLIEGIMVVIKIVKGFARGGKVGL